MVGGIVIHNTIPSCYLCLMFVHVILSCLLTVTSWERADLLAFWYVMFPCVVDSFQYGSAGQLLDYIDCWSLLSSFIMHRVIIVPVQSVPIGAGWSGTFFFHTSFFCLVTHHYVLFKPQVMHSYQFITNFGRCYKWIIPNRTWRKTLVTHGTASNATLSLKMPGLCWAR